MVKRYTSESLDDVFSALADPTRRAILEQLASEEQTVSEIAAPHEISLPAISKHLRVLREAGLLERSKDGRFRKCTLNSKPLREAAAWLDKYRRFWKIRFDKLDNILTPPKKSPKKKTRRRSR